MILGFGGVIAVTTNDITVGELLTFVVYLQMLEQKPVPQEAFLQFSAEKSSLSAGFLSGPISVSGNYDYKTKLLYILFN